MHSAMHALQHGRSARGCWPAPRSAAQQRLSRVVTTAGPRYGRRFSPVLAAAAGEPVAVGLMGGRVLLLPNVNPHVASSSPAAPMPVPSQQPSDLWGAFGSRVSKGGVVQLQDLVGACSSQSASTTTLLVIYAPWCPHCRAMEAEVDKLAAAMAGQVQVLAVRGDTPATRRFIKEELQVNSLPALLLFPAQSRMYFRYRSPHRDALSLQRFIHNMTALTAPSAAAEAPGRLTQQAPAAAAVQAAPTATAATAAGGKNHVSASMAAVRQQLEVVVSSAASGGVPAAVTLAEVKGQMVGLAAVMGISLAVAQTVSNSNSSSGSGSQSAGNGSGAATGEQQELDGNIRNVVHLLHQLLALKAALVWADLQQLLAPLLAKLPLTPAPSGTTEATTTTTSNSSNSSSGSGSGMGMLAAAVELSQTPALAAQGAAPQLLLPAALAATPTAVSTAAAAAPASQQQQDADVAAAGKAAFRSARQYKALPVTATTGSAEVSSADAAAGAAAVTRQQSGAAAGAAATLAALASSTQQLQALASTLDQLDEAQLAQAMTAQLPGQQQEAALTQHEVSVSAADAAALLDVLLAAQGSSSGSGGEEGGVTAGRGKVDSRQLQQLLEELLEKDGQLRA